MSTTPLHLRPAQGDIWSGTRMSDRKQLKPEDFEVNEKDRAST